MKKILTSIAALLLGASLNAGEWVPVDYEPKRGDGLTMQLNWVGHGLIDARYPEMKSFPAWEIPFSIVHHRDFITQLFAESWDIFAMDWAEDLADPAIAFWLWIFWGSESKIITDGEGKSLCYTPAGIGCLLPYAKSFKAGAGVYPQPDKSTKSIHKLNRKDIVFPLTPTSDGRFYQVIIYPNAQAMKRAKTTQEALTIAVKSKPINGFIQKKALKSPPKPNPLIQFDMSYADVAIFSTPPKMTQEYRQDKGRQ